MLNSSVKMGPVVSHSSERQVTEARPERVHQWPENMPLGVQPAMQELTDAIRSLANGKALEPDGVSVELFKIKLNDDPTLWRRLLDIVVCIRKGGGRSSENIPSSLYSTKRRFGQSSATTEVSRIP